MTSTQPAELSTDAQDGPPPEPQPEEAPAELVGVEIAPPAASVPAVVDFQPPMIPGRDEFLALASQARIMASSALVPKALRGKPADVFLVLLTGRDIGIPTTVALRLVHVIDSQPTLAPKLRIALITRSGAGRIRPHPNNSDEWAAAEVFGPDGSPLGPPVVYTWVMAQIAGMVSAHCKPREHKQGCSCKANYKTYPGRMLWWRAAGYAADDYFPEVGMGLYSPDELGAVTNEDGEPIDVASVEVPAGFVNERAAAAEDTVAPDDELEALGERLAILPPGLRDEAKAAWKAHPTLQAFTLRNLLTSKVSLAKALVSGFESKARSTGWNQEEARAAYRAGQAAATAPQEAEGAEPPPEEPAAAEGGAQPAEDGAGGGQPIDMERAQRIVAHVKRLDPVTLDAQLSERGIKPEHSLDARQRTLGVALYNAGFDPAQEGE